MKRDKKEKVKRNRSREKTDSDKCDIFDIYLINYICKNCLYIDIKRNDLWYVFEMFLFFKDLVKKFLLY